MPRADQHVGNGVATMVMSAWEKELDRDKLRAVLRGEVPAATEAETEVAGA